MAKQVSIKQLIAKYRAKTRFIEDYLSGYDKELATLQKELYGLIITEYATKFVVKDGVLILNEKNARLIKELDKVLEQFKTQFSDDVFKGTAESMLKLTGLTSDYFRVMNFSSKTLNSISDKLEILKTTIGIDSKGNIIAGSFIDNLASTPAVKTQLSEYVRTSLQQGVSYKDFVSGFKTQIEGNPDVNGTLERYAGQYVHDAMYSHAQTVDNFFADELGITSFLYAGDEIKTTRDFCAVRAGNVYTRDEIDSWNDEDWAGKIPGVDVWVQRGGYQCRHNFMPVDEAAAAQLSDLATDEEEI